MPKERIDGENSLRIELNESKLTYYIFTYVYTYIYKHICNDTKLLILKVKGYIISLIAELSEPFL